MTSVVELPRYPSAVFRFLCSLLFPDATRVDDELVEQDFGRVKTGQRRYFYDASESTGAEENCALTATGATTIVDVEKDLSRALPAFREAVETDLRVDIDELRDECSRCPSSSAVEACIQLARRIAPTVVLACKVESAAFIELTGAVALVLQSMQTHRRLTYRISPDGGNVSILQIDENMTVLSAEVGIDDKRGLRERAEWVSASR